MLFLTRYCPKQFESTLINKKFIKKLCKFNKNNFMNILIYGVDGTGKYVLSKMLLNHIFNKNIYKLKTNIYELNSKNLIYYSSIYHYEIYLTKFTNKKILCELILSLTESLNVNNNMYNIILIKNIHYLDNDTSFFFKNIIEKRCDFVKFIFISNSLTKINYVLKNLFLNLRVPKLNLNEILQFLEKIKNLENIKITNEQLILLIENQNFNITKILINLELYKKTKLLNNYDYLEKKINVILNLVYTKQINNIELIRKNLYSITSKNVDKSKIFLYIFNNILEKINSNKKKKEYIDFVSNLNHRFVESYKDIIHIEFLLVKSMIFIE